jgi:stage II sporulation protein D
MVLRRKWILTAATGTAALLLLLMLIPGFIVKRIPVPANETVPVSGSAKSGSAEDVPATQSVMVPIFMTKENHVDTITLEDYVRGVLAAEMPIDFELEALKAQALAARTYLVKRLLDGDSSNVPVKDAIVTDTVVHQAYLGDEELKKKWPGPEYAANMKKLNQAVAETQDYVLTYAGKPINATFFSTSNGYTENSEDYWGEYEPYLRSVPSPWDSKLSPRYKETVTFSLGELRKKLGVGTISQSVSGASAIQVLSRTAGHRIKEISIGHHIFTGREVREKLGLNSSQFEWHWKGDQLEITTYGYGHGVGMSQWGAEGMAKEGKKAEEIVKYYYTGIELTRAGALLSKEREALKK